MTTTSAAGLQLLEMRDITMSFPGVRALDQVSLDLRPGEVHALVGENGAGKSTLMKILGAVIPHGSYGGEIRIGGEVRHFSTIHEAAAAGIAVVHQELSLVRELSIAENILLGREPHRFGIIDTEELYSRAQSVLDEMNLRMEAHIPVGYLGIGQQHLVEIAKALSHRARILVLDEPTAALTDSETATLFEILNRLREQGAGIIYISHKLDEVFRLSDRITVIRDGRTVGSESTASTSRRRVISLMVGRDVSDVFPSVERTSGDVTFEARGVTVEDPNVPGKLLVDNVSFAVRRGEVLGIAGLIGAGRSDLLMALFGAHPGRMTGQRYVGGQRVEVSHPWDAIAHGIGFVTEDRKRFGLMLDQSLLDNMVLTTLRLSGRFLTEVDAETAIGQRAMNELRIKAPSLLVSVETLSGGNQQKAVLAKWLLTRPRVLFLDEPTRGIDVGAKQEIYMQINRLAAEGLAIVLVSSELPEVLALSDRVMVLHNGRMTGEFERSTATPEAIMACATGALLQSEP